MAKKISAGILLYHVGTALEFLLVHPGGPFFAKKDNAFWSIPKGEIDLDEDPERAARREFKEELGIELGMPGFSLDYVIQKGGKQVFAWACQCDDELRQGIEASDIEQVCEKFEMEWPPRSKKMQSFPEIDRAEFFTLENACSKINPGQIPLLERLVSHLNLPR